jgi:hypothetical protein
VAYDNLKVISLEDAFELVFTVLRSNKLSTRDESMLESLILSCPQVTVDNQNFILRDDLNNFCRNFIRSLRENDSSFLFKEKGYKGRLVDVEEFLESKEYMNQKGAVRPIVKYEMQSIVERLDNTREVVLTGCVSGDTLLKIGVPSKIPGKKFHTYPMNMRKLYEIFNRIIPNPYYSDDLHTLSLKEDNTVSYNRIEKVFHNGIKKVYRVTTETKKIILCTKEHKFRISGKKEFVALSELKEGDFIICRAPNKKGEGRKKYNHNRTMVYSVPFHPNARKHTIAGKNYKRIYYSRIVVDAALNGISEQELIKIVRTNEEKANTLHYSDPTLVVHHLDLDESNDKLSNLVLITKKEHDQLHGPKGAANLGNCVIWEEEIKEIKYIGKREVYDLQMQDPYRNYEADGIIVKNSTGWGKSYLSRLLIAYMLYRLSMLHNPQYQYELAPGSSIVMILQSLSLRLSKKILFDPLLSALAASKYFIKNFPFNKHVASELQFPNNIYVSPVSGSEMATLGLDVYAGVMSELNYFAVVENSKQLTMRGQEDTTYDQASNAYTNLIQRLKSRFQIYGKIPGCLILDSAVHYPGDFLSKKIEEAKWDNQIYVIQHAIWDTLSQDHFSGKKFIVEIGTLDRSSRILESKEFAIPEADLLEVPEEYRSDFERDIEMALRDFAGLATGHRRAFMPFKESVVDACTVYESVYNGNTLFTEDSIDLNNYFSGPLEWDLLINNSYLKQISFNEGATFVLSVDLGLSQDRTGLAVGHIQEYKSMPSTSFFSRENNAFTEMLNIEAPVICIDGMLQIYPPAGQEINVDFLKGFMIYLTRRLNIKIITMDSYQDVSFKQAFNNLKGVRHGTVSTVASPLPYMELKTAYVEGRIIHQKHDLYINELLFLEYDPKKQRIDHIPSKSKDISDAVSSVVNVLIHKVAQYKRSRKEVNQHVPAHRQIVVNKL